MRTLPERIASVLTLTLVLSGTGLCQEGAGEHVAVLPFSLQGVTPEEGVQLTQRFTAIVTESKRFSVLPPVALNSILEKPGHRNIDRCESLSCLGQLGKELGVEKIVHVRVVHREALYVLFIRLVNVDGASLLYSERVDHHGEFGALLSQVIPEQALNLTKAHLDAKTPWLPAIVIFAACFGAILWIYSHLRRDQKSRKSPEPTLPP